MQTPASIARVRSPRKRKQSSQWILVFLAAGFLGWMAWRLFQPPPVPPALPPGDAVTNRPVPPAPAIKPAPAPARGPVETPAIPPAPVPAPRPTNAAAGPGMERILAAQVALVRQGISPGSLDGRLGAQTRAALRAFQKKTGASATSVLDGATEARLDPAALIYTHYLVAPEDIERLLPVSHTWLGKSLQPRLDYESILELVAERSQSHPGLLRRLNPEVNWDAVSAGTAIRVPNLEWPSSRGKAAFARISLSGRTLQAFDQHFKLVAHFPCSIAQRMEKRPLGELHVAVLAPNPNYTFDPAIFPESAEGRRLGRKLVLPPGPNNPVGTVWIGLDRPGYGIHGTPRPEEVGRTESHGCFRLANWNAEYFLRLIWLGMPVLVEE